MFSSTSDEFFLSPSDISRNPSAEMELDNGNEIKSITGNEKMGKDKSKDVRVEFVLSMSDIYLHPCV